MNTFFVAAFWVSALLLLHMYAGYPILMWLRARWRPRQVSRRPWTPTVSVIMAVHNGIEHVARKLDNLSRLDYPLDKLDVVVVCDGCDDDTASLLRAQTGLTVRVIEHEARRGKAACLNDAVAAARGEVLLMTDIRQRLNADALSELVANLADPDVGAVSGELCFLDPGTGFARGVDAYWRYEKFIRRAESRSDSTVGVTGALYAMRRELFRPLPTGTVLDDVLVPMCIVADGWRVVFEGRAVAWDFPSEQPEQERRRKIRTLAGNFQLVQLAPWLLLPGRNRLWFRFFSHKLLRLLAPWLMLVLVASATALTRWHMVYALVVAAVAGGLSLVLLGRLLPRMAKLLPIRLATAVWYLNLFAAESLVAFARNRRLHLW